MTANCKRTLLFYGQCVLFGCLVGCLLTASLPFIGGLYFGMCGDRMEEQVYLDQCIAHLKLMRAHCDDPDLQGILDYAIWRYSKVGAWDVMFMPLSCGFWSYDRTLGCNCPFCPGITIDTSALTKPPEMTAITIVHEALHDYWPYLGHAHITQRGKRLYELSYVVQALRGTR